MILKKIKGRLGAAFRELLLRLRCPGYFGGGVVVAGLVAAGAGFVIVPVPVPAGLVVTGLAGAGTPDCTL